MSIMEVEMEDTEKRLSEPGNNLQVSESKVFDDKVESEVEKSPLAAAVLGDVNEGENGGEDLNKCRTEINHRTELKSEDYINPKSEADKPIEGTDSGNINIKSENEELLNTVASDQEQTVPISQVERQIDVENEVVAQKSTNGGVEEKMSAENDMEDGDCQKNVEKRPNEDVAEKKPNEPGKEDMANVESMENSDAGDNLRENRQLPTELSANKDPQKHDAQSDEVQQGEDEEMEGAGKSLEDKTSKEKEQGAGAVLACSETDGSDKTVEIAGKNDGEESSLANQHITAKSSCLSAKGEDHSGEIANTFFTQSTLSLTGEGDDGTPEEQAAFMKELESFYREKAMDFKPPKFYGQPLNCLKLWMAVIRLGGYDKVTGSKLWRQVGESFHPPKTCTTVSWTFRIFYEKSLLEYERHKTQSGELQLPIVMLPNVSGADGEGNGYHGSGSGRARRDSAARAMQGWHAQRLSDSGEDKNLNNMAKHEKNVKSIVSLKQKRPNEVEHSNKAARIELSKQLSLGYKLVTSVVDIGPPADWVKINVRQLKDCFEVYALIPGLLREEVRVQSDPAGRVVITGQPEQVDNPWGITPFKKVVSLPGRIDPVQTSAVVSLHGRLLVRVPFEQQQQQQQPNL